ncbi:hypothetical protein N7526_011159 [Penicillium atrosanguineum]|nr:hypothetical protein N7526_011159 [Penicillium atrosanguineum]
MPSIEIELSGMQDAVIDTNSGPASAEQSETREDAILPMRNVRWNLQPREQECWFQFYALHFLTSPIVEIIAGETVLKVHRNFILDSPLRQKRFWDAKFVICGAFTCEQERRSSWMLFAVPVHPRLHRTASRDSVGRNRFDGRQLRRYARIYTLAEKLGLPALKCLAHTKIHGLKGTPSDELVYARCIYTYTPQERHHDTRTHRVVLGLLRPCFAV